MWAVADRHAPSRCSWTTTIWPASVLRQRVLSSLKHAIIQRDRVVVVHGALMLHAEDPVQIFTPSAHKGAPFLRRRNRKPAVELCDVLSHAENRWPAPRSVMPRIRNSCGRRPCHVPKLRSDAPSCFRRIRRDHLHTEFLQRPPHLRQTASHPLAAALRRDERNGPPDRCTASRTRLCVSITSRNAAITVRVIRLPPTARSRSRWSHRPGCTISSY